MRLTPAQIDTIKSTAQAVLGEGMQLNLLCSRVELRSTIPSLRGLKGRGNPPAPDCHVASLLAVTTKRHGPSRTRHCEAQRAVAIHLKPH